MYKLIIEDDEGKTTEVPIIRDEITVGRKEGNTIRLTERNVSRRHARITRQNNALYIEDLLSYNGIKVNGDRIQGKVAIGDGDRVQIGDYQLSIKLDKAAVKPGAGPMGQQATARQDVGMAGQATVPVQAVVAGAHSSLPTVQHPAVAPSQVKAPDKPARLIVISTNFARQEFPLDKAAVVIGRTDDNDVVLNHRSISRHHAKIVREGEHFHIVDMQSANGVRVNGEEYGKVELRKGDQIDLGHVRLIFVPPGQDIDIRDKIVDLDRKGAPVVAIVTLALLVLGAGGAAFWWINRPAPVDAESDAAKLLVELLAEVSGAKSVAVYLAGDTPGELVLGAASPNLADPPNRGTETQLFEAFVSRSRVIAVPIAARNLATGSAMLMDAVPQPEKDPVIQIANLVIREGRGLVFAITKWDTVDNTSEARREMDHQALAHPGAAGRMSVRARPAAGPPWAHGPGD